MQLIVYDGSFEGFLTAVFDVYEYKFSDVQFSPEQNYQQSIFNDAHEVHTDETRAARVWTGLKERITTDGLNQLYRAFLSEKRNIESTLLSYIRYAFKSKGSIEQDYSHRAVLSIAQTARIVYREKHRMEAFIRFQLTKDGLFYAVVEPDFNVLPLIKKHFYERYADQNWLIYDARRKYGLYYDQQKIEQVAICFNEEAVSPNDITSIYDEHEELYQKLWKQYFSSVNIKARKNMKLHIQHMPRRYWKHLTEKSS